MPVHVSEMQCSSIRGAKLIDYESMLGCNGTANSLGVFCRRAKTALLDGSRRARIEPSPTSSLLILHSVLHSSVPMVCVEVM